MWSKTKDNITFIAKQRRREYHVSHTATQRKCLRGCTLERAKQQIRTKQALIKPFSTIPEVNQAQTDSIYNFNMLLQGFMP